MPKAGCRALSRPGGNACAAFRKSNPYGLMVSRQAMAKLDFGSRAISRKA